MRFHERDDCAMTLKCDRAEVVDEACMNFSNELTRRLGKGMSNSVLELVQSECRQVQRLAIVTLVKGQKWKGKKGAPVNDDWTRPA